MMLTAKQQAMFWRVFQAAWREQSLSQGLDHGDAALRDAYRRGLVRRATGRGSLTEVGRTHEFDELMSLASREAGLHETASHASLSGERRALHRMLDCARQVCEASGMEALESDDARWGYARATLLRAFRHDDWQDLAAPQLDAAFMMLDTQRRRILKAAGWRGGRGDPEHRLGYELGTRYRRTPDGRVVRI